MHKQQQAQECHILTHNSAPFGWAKIGFPSLQGIQSSTCMHHPSPRSLKPRSAHRHCHPAMACSSCTDRVAQLFLRINHFDLIFSAHRVLVGFKYMVESSLVVSHDLQCSQQPAARKHAARQAWAVDGNCVLRLMDTAGGKIKGYTHLPRRPCAISAASILPSTIFGFPSKAAIHLAFLYAPFLSKMSVACSQFTSAPCSL